MRVSKSTRAYIAILLASWVLVGPVFAKPTELIRNPMLEFLGISGFIHQYRVYYKNCARGPGATKWKLEFSYRSLFLGANNVFPALSDEGAEEFAAGAFPDCQISSIYRYRRHPLGANYRYNKNSKVLIYPR